MARSIPLTCYLVKQELQQPEEAVEEEYRSHKSSIIVAGRQVGTLFLKPSEPHPPSWAGFFEGQLPFDVSNSSTSAVFVVPAGDRLFAVVFGYGRTMLQASSYEESFGLRTVLNAVAPERIRTIDATRLESAQQSRIQANQATDIGQFGLDIEQDLVRAVTGELDDNILGRRITGRDAVQITAPVRLDGVAEVLQHLLRESSRGDFREKFPWIEHISEVKDKQALGRLDESLASMVRDRNFDHVWLAVPELIEWARIDHFKYALSKSAVQFPFDLHLNDFLSIVQNVRLTDVALLRERKAFAISSDSGIAAYDWPIYKCLYAEIKDGKNRFVLTGGKWYRIATDFVSTLEQDVAQIPVSRLVLPAYSHKDEAEYNKHVAGQHGFALMDRKNIRFRGRATPVEFCDLFTREHELIHVKRYASSSQMSHLFAQGTVSAELFAQEPDFRRQVNKKLPSDFRVDSKRNPRTGEYTVVFGIVSKSAKPLELPIFSKITLRNATRRLGGLGFGAHILKIPAQVVNALAA